MRVASKPELQRTAAVAEPSRSAFVVQRRSFKFRSFECASKFACATAGLRHSRGPFSERAGRRSSVFLCSLNNGCNSG
jgi:hypothetical protein